MQKHKQIINAFELVRPSNRGKMGDRKKMIYTQIDIDFDVWKAITIRRLTPDMTENGVLRELLGLGKFTAPEVAPVRSGAEAKVWETKGVQFPVGTDFRATYKGLERQAKVTESGIEYDGTTYKSVSAAANAVTGNQVNGWRFWECRLPGQTRWTLIDEIFNKVHKKD
jgi:hypothetical protein